MNIVLHCVQYHLDISRVSVVTLKRWNVALKKRPLREPILNGEILNEKEEKKFQVDSSKTETLIIDVIKDQNVISFFSLRNQFPLKYSR